MQSVNSLPARLTAPKTNLQSQSPVQASEIHFSGLFEPPKSTVDTRVLKLKPNPSRLLLKRFDFVNRFILKSLNNIKTIEVKNADTVKKLREEGYQVIITPNHPGHGDVFLMQELSKKVDTPFCYMSASWVFGIASFIPEKWRHSLLTKSGMFPVNQEFSDEASKNTAFEVVKDGKAPLVMFPEGILSWQNERIAFVNHGPASIGTEAAYALMEEHKLNPDKPMRKVALIPVGIKHTYEKNIVWGLDEEIERLEDQLRLPPNPRSGVLLSVEGLGKRTEKIWMTMLDQKEKELTGSVAENKATTLVERHNQSLKHFEEAIEKMTGIVPDKTQAYVKQDKQIRAELFKGAQIPGKEFATKKERTEYINDVILPVMDFAFALKKLLPDYMGERPGSQDRLAETLFLLDRLLNGKSKVITKLGTRKSTMQVGEPIDLTKLLSTTVKPEGMDQKTFLRSIKGVATDKLKDSLVDMVATLSKAPKEA